jgi:Pyruvate/2-oxoacid:ferredoxin oxidoreductase delta subunit
MILMQPQHGESVTMGCWRYARNFVYWSSKSWARYPGKTCCLYHALPRRQKNQRQSRAEQIIHKSGCEVCVKVCTTLE